MPLQKNEIHTATIEGYSSEGQGVARIDGQVVFVKEAISGEICRVRILKSNASVAWGKIEELLQPSPRRVAPNCSVFGPCGGCDLLHMSYEEELRLKQNRVADSFARIAGLSIPISPIIPAQETEHYRNKAIFAVDDTGKTGFYRRRSHQIIPVDDCKIQHPSANRAACALGQWLTQKNIPPGLVRHLFTRSSYHSGDLAVCIVAREDTLPQQEALIETILKFCPETTGILLCTNKSPGNVVLDGRFQTLWGKPQLEDKLCKLNFQLSPRSFFQINPPQAERLYEKALAYAALTGTETVLDLYCGTGTITQIFAKQAKYAIGAEIVPTAVSDAIENAQQNDIENTQFICADAKEAKSILQERNQLPDVVVVDPPRKGLSPEVILDIVDIKPSRVVYISCDPGTLARDLKQFHALGYQAVEATPVDMFPRTAHVECVVLMTRVEGAQY